eukprot:2953821-Rhodomonas_salina.1
MGGRGWGQRGAGAADSERMATCAVRAMCSEREHVEEGAEGGAALGCSAAVVCVAVLLLPMCG